jgi:hypothetical protein
VDLSEEILNESDLKPGSQLIVLTNKGRITLIDSERLWELVEEPLQEMLSRLQESLARDPDAPFLGGLTYEEYAALSDDEDKALWDRLWKEAEREVKIVEREIPPHVRPARQERR